MSTVETDLYALSERIKAAKAVFKAANKARHDAEKHVALLREKEQACREAFGKARQEFFSAAGCELDLEWDEIYR